MVRSRKREGLGFCLSGFIVKLKRERENMYKGFSFLLFFFFVIGGVVN